MIITGEGGASIDGRERAPVVFRAKVQLADEKLSVRVTRVPVGESSLTDFGQLLLRVPKILLHGHLHSAKPVDGGERNLRRRHRSGHAAVLKTLVGQEKVGVIDILQLDRRELEFPGSFDQVHKLVFILMELEPLSHRNTDIFDDIGAAVGVGQLHAAGRFQLGGDAPDRADGSVRIDRAGHHPIRFDGHVFDQRDQRCRQLHAR